MTNKNTFQQFDILKFFDQYGINYTERGKNIGTDWVGIDECPFCGIGGNHFDINLQSKGFSCWGCGEKGSAPVLIRELLKVSFGEAYSIINNFYDGELEFTIRETGEKVVLPSGITELMKSGGDYLRSRNYNPFLIRDKYKVQQTGTNSILKHNGMKSIFRNRLIIPIYMQRQLVGYTGRDYTNKQEPKYKHVFLEACILPPSSCLYNIDTVKDKAIFVEGPTDSWRMGDRTVSLQGIKVTKEQIRLISDCNLKLAVILFDAGKEKEATKLATTLTGFVKKVQVAHLPKGDPGELSDIEALKIKHQLIGGLNGKRYDEDLKWNIRKF